MGGVFHAEQHDVELGSQVLRTAIKKKQNSARIMGATKIAKLVNTTIFNVTMVYGSFNNS